MKKKMSEEAVSIFDGELKYKDPNFIGPPLTFGLTGTRIASGGDPNKPLYNANTDVINIMPFALERVLFMLLSTDFNPMADKVMDDHNITIKELEKTYRAFCNALDYFTGPQARSTIDEASAAAGYAERPAIEKLLVEGMLGRIMLAFYWFGIRERTVAGGMPPVPPAYNRLPILWNEINQALDGIETPYAKEVKEKYGVILKDNCAPLNEAVTE